MGILKQKQSAENRLIRRQASSVGPVAEGVDFFAHGDGEWRRRFERVDDTLGGQLAFGGEGIVEGGDDGLLDLGAAVSFGGGGEGGNIEILWIALALL